MTHFFTVGRRTSGSFLYASTRKSQANRTSQPTARSCSTPIRFSSLRVSFGTRKARVVVCASLGGIVFEVSHTSTTNVNIRHQSSDC